MSLDDGWLPGWQKLPSQVKEGEYFEGAHPARLTWHTTEGFISAGSTQGHRAPPQLWASPRTRLKVQSIPLVWSGYACWDQRDYPQRTNTITNHVQVEVEGFAGQTQTWPAEWLDWLADEVLVPVMQFWAHHRVGFDPMAGPDIANEQMGGSAADGAPQRFGWDQWARFNSQAGHRHVPGNGDRWDPGPLDVKHIGRRAVARLGGGSFAPASVDPEELTVADITELNKRLDIIARDVGNSNTYAQQRFEHIETAAKQRAATLDKVVNDLYKWQVQLAQQLDAADAKRDETLRQAVDKLTAAHDGEPATLDLASVPTTDLLAEVSRRTKAA